MKISIESTSIRLELDGVPVRVWRGVTEDGVTCEVLVHRILADRTTDTRRFDRELEEQEPPRSATGTSLQGMTWSFEHLR